MIWVESVFAETFVHHERRWPPSPNTSRVPTDRTQSFWKESFAFQIIDLDNGMYKYTGDESTDQALCSNFAAGYTLKRVIRLEQEVIPALVETAGQAFIFAVAGTNGPAASSMAQLFGIALIVAFHWTMSGRVGGLLYDTLVLYGGYIVCRLEQNNINVRMYVISAL